MADQSHIPGRSAAMRAISATVLLVCLWGTMVPRCVDGATGSKGLVIDLQASWGSTSLLHEAAEFLGDTSVGGGFFEFVREWRSAADRKKRPCSAVHNTSALDGDCCWSTVQNSLSAAVSSHGQMYQMGMVALASRQYSPRLETFRQLSEGWFSAGEACCWVVVNGKDAIRDASELGRSVDRALQETNGASEEIIIDIDHLFQEKNRAAGAMTLTLYGPLDSDCSHRMHDTIVNDIIDSKGANVSYLWRPIPYTDGACQDQYSCSPLGAGGNMSIPGYGVDLAIKNMEYNAKDSTEEDDPPRVSDISTPGFDIQKLTERYPENKMELESFGSHLDSKDKKSSIKAWELKDIGMQTVEKVLTSKDSLSVLRDVSQNFPTMVGMVSKVPVSKHVRTSMKSLSSYLAPDAEALFVNGLSFALGDLNWHAMLDVLRSESEFLLKLHTLGITPSKIPEIIKLRNGRGGQEDEGGFRLDFQPEDEVFWMSNVEEDESFEALPSRLSGLLQPGFMGQVPAVRRNIFTALLVVDVGSRGGAMSLVTAKGLLDQGLPVRIGVVPVAHKPSIKGTSQDLSRIFTALGLTVGGRQASNLFAASAAAMDQKGWDMEEHFPQAMYNALLKQLKPIWKTVGSQFDGVSLKGFAGLLRDSKNQRAQSVTAFLEAATARVQGLGIHEFPEAGGTVIFNGVLYHVDSAPMWRPVLVNAWQTEVPLIQRLVYENRLSDSSVDLLADILLLHGAIPRFNPRVLSKPTLLGDGESENDPQAAVNFAHVSSTLDVIEGMKLAYFSQVSLVDTRSQHFPVTHWVVVNPSSDAGLALMSEALSHESPDSRIGLVLNTEDPSCSNDDLPDLDSFVLGLSLGPPGDASEADYFDILASVSSATAASLTRGGLEGAIPEGVFRNSDGLKDYLGSIKYSNQLQRHCRFVRDHLGLSEGISGVLTNGRFLKQRFAGDVVAKDFRILDQVAQSKFYATKKLMEVLKSTLADVDGGRLSTIAALASSVIMVHTSGKDASQSSQVLELFDRTADSLKLVERSAFKFDTASLQVQAVFDPLSKVSQQISPILSFFKESLHVNIEVILNPKQGYSDVPLKNYYRYVMPRMEGIGTSPAATFSSLPLHDTLTLGMDVPEMWLVSPTSCKHDLDNIQLSNLPATEKNLVGRFRLDSILVTGMCVDFAAFESGRNAQVHPRGVQLNLGTPGNPAMSDTLVMSNLGYFQLKATPGMWHLRLAPGRSEEIYHIKTVTGRSEFSLMTSSAVIRDNAAILPVASFSGEHIMLLLRPNKGRAGEDVLDVKKGAVTSRKTRDERIHVFTVASGHMYERLQKIMILSAIKRSSRRIKFWFIENYMSPQMKDFVPHMAQQYGFDYEFVTYKWPSWLHKQSEKQRIIWAYKILFLDVLFPLGLKKVIFCDSDQVIRADLAELWDHNLHGAPYGYTPFCDNNKDMDGFRFWKQGFWKNHLQGKPYHISALYVVDLERFRSMAAGDQLRVIYDQLSKDPNSLSNLDQDLPNFAQDQVPIASLPQEWLWCETWCGNATRPKAKTIDLCNNPLTKEPKLQSARRIIAEWSDLNREAEEFTARVDAYLDGAMTEEELSSSDSSRFMVNLKPMVEGSFPVSHEAHSGTHDHSEL